MSLATAPDSVTAPLHRLTIQDWHDRYGDYEGRCELVHGRAIMTPTEAFRNIDATQALALRLALALGDGWKCRPNVSVSIQPDPVATVRSPDLAVMRAGGDTRRWRSGPAEVALVVEVVSPSSVETDWVTKQEEYAAAGIPNYLIVDVRFDEGPRLWLFDTIVDGAYADPTGDGTSVTIRIPGHAPITITAADLR